VIAGVSNVKIALVESCA